MLELISTIPGLAPRFTPNHLKASIRENGNCVYACRDLAELSPRLL